MNPRRVERHWLAGLLLAWAWAACSEPPASDDASRAGASASGSGGASGAGGAAASGGAAGSAGYEFAPQYDAGMPSVTHPSMPLCPGVPATPNAEPCEMNADCASPAQCLFENSAVPCTLGCVGPFDECGPGTPCSAGLLCTGEPAASITTACSCGGGTRCVAPCTDDASCGSEARCEPDGRCVALGCDEGASCAAWELCDPDDALADARGCRFVRCDEAGAPECPLNQDCGTASADAPSGCRPRACSRGLDCDCGACSPVEAEGQRVCVLRPGACGNVF